MKRASSPACIKTGALNYVSRNVLISSVADEQITEQRAGVLDVFHKTCGSKYKNGTGNPLPPESSVAASSTAGKCSTGSITPRSELADPFSAAGRIMLQPPTPLTRSALLSLARAHTPPALPQDAQAASTSDAIRPLGLERLNTIDILLRRNFPGAAAKVAAAANGDAQKPSSVRHELAQIKSSMAQQQADHRRDIQALTEVVAQQGEELAKQGEKLATKRADNSRTNDVCLVSRLPEPLHHWAKEWPWDHLSKGWTEQGLRSLPRSVFKFLFSSVVLVAQGVVSFTSYLQAAGLINAIRALPTRW